MTASISTLFILAIVFTVFLSHVINTTNDCDPVNWSATEPDTSLNNFYFWFAISRLSISTLIVVALIASTILTIRLVRRNLPEDQRKDAKSIVWIYAIFIICYSAWLYYDIYDAILLKKSGFPSPFLDQLLSMTLPFFWDLMPVLVVLLLHLKIMILTRRQEESQSSSQGSVQKENLSFLKSASVPET